MLYSTERKRETVEDNTHSHGYSLILIYVLYCKYCVQYLHAN